MVRGVLLALGMLLAPSAAMAQDDAAEALPVESPPPAETPPAEPPLAEPEPPPPPPAPILQGFAPIRRGGPPPVSGQPALPVQTVDPTRFVVGQTWSLRAPAPASIRVRIGRVDDLNGRVVVSVSMTGVPCPADMGCETADIAHLPFDRPTLSAAVDQVVARDPGAEDPAFAEGYRYWRSSSRGAAWSIPPAEAAQLALQNLPRRAASAPAVARPHAPPPPEPVLEPPPFGPAPAEAAPAPGEASPTPSETPPSS